MTQPVQSAHNAPLQALSRTAVAGFILTLITTGTAVMAGFGSRWEWWHFTQGFLLLRTAVIGSFLSFAVSLAGTVLAGPESLRRGLGLAALGLTLSFFTAAVPLSWLATAREMPPIHDITTDPVDPPQFVEILAHREQAPNSTVYGGPDIAALQRAAYPDVMPLVLFVPSDRAFDRALAAARSLGWTIVSKNREEGRIEAAQRTFWFGFTDDIVVRVRPEDGGSRIDIRSVSRAGVSDMGVNAFRVRKFIKRLTGA